MNFKDQGIILSIRKYNENSLIVKILSQNHGICSGFVRGALKLKKNNFIYQIGNLISCNWQAKTADNLGTFKIELIKSFLALILSSQLKLKCLTTIINIIEKNILEKEPHQQLFGEMLNLLQNLSNEDNVFLGCYIKLEIELLQILGYGIDLSQCAVTQTNDNLHFVSPKSGRAVSKEVGEKYRHKLLKLPKFLIQKELGQFNKDDLLAGLRLSGFFINKYLYQPDNLEMHNSREGLLNLVKNTYD